VLAGIHDSSANYLRFTGSETGRFTLLSTGTWIIGFDAGADPSRLDPACDTACGLTIHGAQAPICRFMGGEEYERIARGAEANVADLPALIERGVMALPSFTDSGGPAPGTGGAGRLTGAVSQAERGALGALYCAQMTSLALERMSGPDAASRIIVDGPFGQNAAFLGCLAALQPQAAVLASNLREGTAAGAALLAFADANGRFATRRIDLTPAPDLALDMLGAYHARWRDTVDRLTTASAASDPVN
jgi:sugar (pentulose or hexulose) kinase